MSNLYHSFNYILLWKAILDKRAIDYSRQSAPHVIQCHPMKGADMRLRSTTQCFDFSDSSSLRVVQEYRSQYDNLSRIVDENPNLLFLAHHDWATLLSSSREGRSGKFTSEQLLRAFNGHVPGRGRLSWGGHPPEQRRLLTSLCPSDIRSGYGFYSS